MTQKYKDRGVGELFLRYTEQINDSADENRLYNHIAQTIDYSYMTDIYVQELCRMNCMRMRGLKAPHKVVLLVDILRGIAKGRIKDNKIYFNEEFVRAFEYYWRLLVPKEMPFNCGAHYPFVHASSELFYHLNLKKEVQNLSELDSVPKIKRLCNYAYLDRDLYVLALNAKTRNFMIRTMIEHYGLQDNDVLYESESDGQGLNRSNAQKETSKGNSIVALKSPYIEKDRQIGQQLQELYKLIDSLPDNEESANIKRKAAELERGYLLKDVVPLASQMILQMIGSLRCVTDIRIHYNGKDKADYNLEINNSGQHDKGSQMLLQTKEDRNKFWNRLKRFFAGTF